MFVLFCFQSTPQDLPEPLSAQCLASDGRVFQFMCLQLNTTKLDTDDGIKNMVSLYSFYNVKIGRQVRLLCPWARHLTEMPLPLSG